MESDFISSRLKQPTQTTTPITKTTTIQPATHDQRTNTTEAHHQNDDDTQDDDTLLILSQLVQPNLRKTKATTSSTRVQKAAASASRDTLMSEPHLLSSTV